MTRSLPQLNVPDRVVLTEGAGKGLIGWVSATPDTPLYREPWSVAPGHVRVDFEDGVRCILPVEKLETVA